MTITNAKDAKKLTNDLITQLDAKSCYDRLNKYNFDPLSIPIPDGLHGWYFDSDQFCSAIYRKAYLYAAISYVSKLNKQSLDIPNLY